MILNFITHFPDGAPTYFADKVSESFDFLNDDELCKAWDSAWAKTDFYEKSNELFKRIGENANLFFGDVLPKIHSLREDIHDRWCVGMKIHFYVWSRTKKATCFGIGEVKAIQYAIINAQLQRIFIMDEKNGLGHSRELLGTDLADFVLNDGFDSIDQFWKFFTQSKTYKLIHWTDFKY